MTNPSLVDNVRTFGVQETAESVCFGASRDPRDEEVHHDPIDDLDIDELPPAGHDEHTGKRRERLEVEGPGGEPEGHHEGETFDDVARLPAGQNRPGFDSSVAGDLPVGAFDIVEDDRGRGHGNAAGFDRVEDASDDAADFDDRADSDFDPIHVPDDLGDEEDLRPSADDGGAEGTSEDIGAEVDESALPGLDADDGGAFELDDFMRELSRGGFGHESDHDGWALYESWGARVPCFALDVSEGRVVAGGDELLVVEPGTQAARTSTLPRRATAIAASPEGAVVGTARGVLYAPRSPSSPSPLLSMLDTEKPVRALGVFAGRTWALVGDELWQLASPPAPPLLSRTGVLAMARATDALVVLAARPERMLERFRGDDGDWEPIGLSPDARRALATEEAPRVVVSAGCQAVAVACAAGVSISREDGKRTTFLEFENVSALAFSGPSEAATLLVVTIDSSTLSVISVDEKNRTRVVGRIELGRALVDSLGEDGPLGLSIAWDESREALFVASPAGLFAMGPRRTH